MIEVRECEAFAQWLTELRDRRAVARIAVRIERMRSGNLGQVEAIGEGVSEAKIDYGPGYRLYFKRRGREVVILLCGGDKSTQDADIRRAKQLALTIEDSHG